MISECIYCNIVQFSSHAELSDGGTHVLHLIGSIWAILHIIAQVLLVQTS